MLWHHKSNRSCQHCLSLFFLCWRKNIKNSCYCRWSTACVKSSKTRWPVSAAVRASDIVSKSLISPTNITSGSCLRADFKAFEKLLYLSQLPCETILFCRVNKFNGIFNCNYIFSSMNNLINHRLMKLIFLNQFDQSQALIQFYGL